MTLEEIIAQLRAVGDGGLSKDECATIADSLDNCKSADEAEALEAQAQAPEALHEPESGSGPMYAA